MRDYERRRLSGGVCFWPRSICDRLPETGSRSCSTGQWNVIQRRPVGADDPGLALVGERKLVESVHGMRVLRVAVRVVGREDQSLVAKGLHEMRDSYLVGFDRDPAVSFEVLRRRHRQL